MKKTDISPGEYAVRVPGRKHPTRATITDVGSGFVSAVVPGCRFIQSIVLPSVLMPWPQYEEEQERKREFDAGIQEIRKALGPVVAEHSAVAEQLRPLLQDRDIAPKYVDRSTGTITLRLADCAKLLGLGSAT